MPTEGAASLVVGGIDRSKCSDDESAWSWTTAIAGPLAWTFQLKSIRSFLQFSFIFTYCNFISTSTAVISTDGFAMISLMGTFSYGPNEKVNAIYQTPFFSDLAILL
jgi:hypothetical protein